MRKRSLELHLLCKKIQKNKKNQNLNSSNREVDWEKEKICLQMKFIDLKTSVIKDLIIKSSSLREQKTKRSYRVIRFINLRIREVSVRRPVSKAIIKIHMIITSMVEVTIEVAVVEFISREEAETNEVAIEMTS